MQQAAIPKGFRGEVTAPEEATILYAMVGNPLSLTSHPALIHPEPKVTAGSQTISMNRTYGMVTPGDYLALINSFGVLEIARSQRSAAEALGLSRGAPITVVDGAA